MMFRTNETTGSITREQLESGGKKFLEEMLDRDLAFMRSVPNTVQYWFVRSVHVSDHVRDRGTLGVPARDPEVAAGRTPRHASAHVRDDGLERVEFQQRGSAHLHVILWLEEAPDEELTDEECAMPKTLKMVAQLLTLDTTLLRRPRMETHQHNHTCYKRGRTKCQFGASFMPSDETRVVVPFPPAPEGDDAEGERERPRLKALKKKYEEMHEGLESGDIEDLASFLRAFGVHYDKQYLGVLRASLCDPVSFIEGPREEV
ncbi:hypothetical protein MRX96_023474 [Rhipicephalus microplus]